jgi:hypothetical protein
LLSRLKKEAITFYASSPPAPKNDDENEMKKSHGTYRDAEYHHKNSNANKNLAPKNGQEGLNISIAVSNNSDRRIAIRALPNS